MVDPVYINLIGKLSYNNLIQSETWTSQKWGFDEIWSICEFQVIRLIIRTRRNVAEHKSLRNADGKNYKKKNVWREFQNEKQK